MCRESTPKEVLAILSLVHGEAGVGGGLGICAVRLASQDTVVFGIRPGQSDSSSNMDMGPSPRAPTTCCSSKHYSSITVQPVTE